MTEISPVAPLKEKWHLSKMSYPKDRLNRCLIVLGMINVCLPQSGFVKFHSHVHAEERSHYHQLENNKQTKISAINLINIKAAFIQEATGNGNATETALPLSQQMGFNVFVHTEETKWKLQCNSSNAESAVAPVTTCCTPIASFPVFSTCLSIPPKPILFTFINSSEKFLVSFKTRWYQRSLARNISCCQWNCVV